MMSDANDAPIGYAATAEAYWQAGWRGILPFRQRSKWPPPKDTTGYTSPDPSYPDVMAWAEDFRDGNLGLRLPDGVVGIDVDDYDSKTGAATFAEAVRRWGPLPPAPRSTSREGNKVSGIRLFRVPPGTHLETVIAFPDLGIGDVEIIQRHHRYVISWPSIHPEGRPYWWRNDDDQLIGIPRIDDLPWLPPSWIEGLRVQPRAPLNGAMIPDVSVLLTSGTPSERVATRLRTAIGELNLPGTSRHDTCCRHVIALARLGKCGEPGVKQALGTLCSVLVAARQVDKSDTPEGTRLEFDRMLTNDNLARELAQPGLTDWMKDIVIDETGSVPPGEPVILPNADFLEPETEPTPDAPGMGGAANANAPSDNEGRDHDHTRRKSPLEDIEQGFWESRESLQMVWQTSMAMMASPWGVLAHCAARALTQVRPHVTLPPLIGGPGSLNWFALVAAPPSLGKGTAARTAKLLVPDPITEWEVGSGEGMIAVYGRKPEERIEAIMFKAEEMDTINALNTRSGSTTLPILRSGFFGEGLGSAYSDEKKCRRLEDGAYRMTLIVSTQPERAAWLLADAGGGTPQRFMWFPGSDARVSEAETWPAGALKLPRATEWQYPREIVVPDMVRSTIRGNHAKNCRGEIDALNGHALFSREKLAYALAVLDGRIDMTLEDWELSGIAAAISDHTRENVIEAIERVAREEASERGMLRGIEMAAATTMKAFEDVQQWPRVIRWVRDKLEAAGDDGIAMRSLSRSAPKSIREYIPTALKQLASDGLAENPEKTRWMRL